MSKLGIAIFGAAVQADGLASPALARRIGYAIQAASENPGAPIFCSGGIGKTPPSEASVMSETLQRFGIAQERITLDEASGDTLESVIATVGFVRERHLEGCIACSDRYHLPRIRLLLRMLGVDAVSGPLKAGRAGTPLGYWLGMRVREAVAAPYDAGLLLARRHKIFASLGAAGSD